MAEPQAVTQLRETLIGRGPVTVNTLIKKFRSMDTDKNYQLSKEEIKGCLSSLGVEVSAEDLNDIFKSFDKGGDGKISMKEFIEGIMPPLSTERKSMVRNAFKRADTTDDDVITVDELRGIFKPRMDPEFRAGNKTKKQAFSDFLAQFEETDNADGEVTSMEFFTYYGIKGKDMTDEEFEKMLNDTWN